MATEGYPQREQYFAHKYTRLLFRCCLANEIGPEACYLLVQIVHTEDAGRYRKAVNFFNEQLVAVCGFRNVKALDRARQKAVDSGWLNYTAGGKSRPGLYYVIVPDYASELPDASIESDLHPVSLVENDQASGREAGEKRERSGREAGDKRATSIPTPNPDPKEENIHTREAEPKAVPDPEPSVNPFLDCNDALMGIVHHDTGLVIDYRDDPIVWQWQFVRRWNALPGVAQYSSSRLDTYAEKALLERFRERDWDWKTAMVSFPLNFDRPSLVWFLEPGNVQHINGGKYVIRDFTKGKQNGKRTREQNNRGSTYVEGQARPNDF